MSWYYADNGRQAGPVDEASLDGLIRQGAIKADTLVWKEGMANWQPLGTVRPMAPPPPPAAPAYTPPPPQQQPQSYQPQGFQPQYQQPQQQSYQQPQQQQGGVTCANCGQMFAATDVVFIGSSYVCAGCKPVFLQRMREGSAGGAVGVRRYAGFWIRVAAALIDAVIINVVMYAVMFAVLAPIRLATSNQNVLIGAMGLLYLVILVAVLAYPGYFLSTKGATPGKMLLGLQVIRSDGSRLTFLRGSMRQLAQALNFGIGYIIAAFDAEKRALHDHLCDTRVVYK